MCWSGKEHNLLPMRQLFIHNRQDVHRKGILPDVLVAVVYLQLRSEVAITLPYPDASGCLGNEVLYRDRGPGLEIATMDTLEFRWPRDPAPDHL